MVSINYTILQRVAPPEKCYLFEVLLWRAFGRFPIELFALGGEDWRFESDVRDGFDAPFPGGSELTKDECNFAGIPADPRMTALLNDEPLLSLDHYDSLLARLSDSENIDQADIEQIKSNREQAALHQEQVGQWLLEYSDYVDQFQAEICLALRNGRLTAYGTRLPHPDYDETEKLLEAEGKYLDDLEASTIPSGNWISSAIKWETSALNRPTVSFIWVHVLAENMLDVFPPNELIAAGKVVQLGETFAVSASDIGGAPRAPTNRGRPALPWQDFHVEVARLCRDGELPEKKEAAIAHFQFWFKSRFGKQVSRSAIGEKLKPYFDALVPKDKK